jgi:hypothetical protein
MSRLLESMLDDQRRAECVANDRALAQSLPIRGYENVLQRRQSLQESCTRSDSSKQRGVLFAAISEGNF